MIHRAIRKSQIQGAVIVLILALPVAILLRFVLIHVDIWCSGLAVAVMAFLAFLSLTATFWPHLHPLMQMLKPFGDVWAVAAKIDAELADPEHTVVAPQVRWDGLWRWHPRVGVTRHWVINLSPAAAAVAFLPDIVWVYKQLTVVGGFARGKVAPGVGCHRRDGGHVWFRTECEDDAEAILEAIVERRPDVLTGFRGEWIDLAKASPMAQAEEVERRRTAVAKLTPEEREHWIDDRLTDLHEAVRRLESPAAASRMV